MPFTTPSRSPDTLLQNASHHLSSLLRQVPTHPNAQLSESDAREQPTTVHPKNLRSMPIFSYTFTLQPIHKLSPLHSIHAQSSLLALRSTLYHSQLFSLHPFTLYLVFPCPISIPLQIHTLFSLFYHCSFARHVPIM